MKKVKLHNGPWNHKDESLNNGLILHLYDTVKCMLILLWLTNSFSSLSEFIIFTFHHVNGLNQYHKSKTIAIICKVFKYYKGIFLQKVTEGAGLVGKKGTDSIPLFPPHLAMDAGQVGLALSYALTLMGMFQWCVRQSTEVENMVMFILTCLAFSSPLAIKWHKSTSYVKY